MASSVNPRPVPETVYAYLPTSPAWHPESFASSLSSTVPSDESIADEARIRGPLSAALNFIVEAVSSRKDVIGARTRPGS
jgi:hypothetical protein